MSGMLFVKIPCRIQQAYGRPRLRNVNKQFPLTIDTEWRVFDNLRQRSQAQQRIYGSARERPSPRYIKVLVEVAETGEAQIIIAGTYQWQFPVMVGNSGRR